MDKGLRKKMSAKVIQFPNQPISEKAKQAMQEEIKMKRVEQSLNTMMLSKYWEPYTLTVEDWEMLALYGEVMKFDPVAASRLISKTADFVKRMSKTLGGYIDEYGDLT